MSILKYEQWGEAYDLANLFQESISKEILLESSEESKNILNNIVKYLKLNVAIIFSFGTGMELLIPIVRNLCENGELKINLTIETVAMMTLTAVTIAYLEEAKEEKLRRQLEKDSRSLLEEMKLRGVGNGIIKKIVRCIKSIGSLAKLIFRHKKTVVTSFFEMFGYAALCVPILNGLKTLVGTYQMTLDSFSHNISTLLLGIGGLSVKSIINWFSNRKSQDVSTEFVDSGYEADSEDDKLIKEQ